MEYQDSFLLSDVQSLSSKAQQVSQGRFGTASEAIRAGLRLLEEREMKLATLRRALVEGEESGMADYSLKGLINMIDHEGLV